MDQWDLIAGALIESWPGAFDAPGMTRRSFMLGAAQAGAGAGIGGLTRKLTTPQTARATGGWNLPSGYRKIMPGLRPQRPNKGGNVSTANGFRPSSNLEDVRRKDTGPRGKSYAESWGIEKGGKGPWHGYHRSGPGGRAVKDAVPHHKPKVSGAKSRSLAQPGLAAKAASAARTRASSTKATGNALRSRLGLRQPGSIDAAAGASPAAYSAKRQTVRNTIRTGNMLRDRLGLPRSKDILRTRGYGSSLDAGISRRGFLKGAAGAASSAMTGAGLGALGAAGSVPKKPANTTLHARLSGARQYRDTPEAQGGFPRGKRKWNNAVTERGEHPNSMLRQRTWGAHFENRPGDFGYKHVTPSKTDVARSKRLFGG